MGFDCGFDIHPRLEVDTSDKRAYQQFLTEIIRTYGNDFDKNGRRPDGKVLETPTDADSGKLHIRFMVGECPSMPCYPDHCNYFLRFSSKISGRLTAPAEPYIRSVYMIAKQHFGSKVHFWHEQCETGDVRQWGCYDWQEIHDANEELEELGKHYEPSLQDQDASDETQVPHSIISKIPVDLTNSLPTFEDLPDEYSIDLRYYGSSDGYYYRPRKHWCFLAEIDAMDEFMRIRLWVKDKAGAIIPISFYTEGRGFEVPTHLFRTGNTAAVLYAHQHDFLDLSRGIRLESIGTCKIFERPLKNVLDLIRKTNDNNTACDHCGASAAGLSKCGACRAVWYCNKSCQKLAWQASHKTDCKLLRNGDFSMLLQLDRQKFENYNTFSS